MCVSMCYGPRLPGTGQPRGALRLAQRAAKLQGRGARRILRLYYGVCYFGCSKRDLKGSFKGDIDVDVDIDGCFGWWYTMGSFAQSGALQTCP